MLAVVLLFASGLALFVVGFVAFLWLRQRKRNKPKTLLRGGAVGSIGSFPSKFFAPFVDTSSTSQAAILACPCNYVSLGFVVADKPTNGKPTWNGTKPLSAMSSLVAAIRASKRDCIVSCGGESGTEIGMSISNVNELAKAYAKVVQAGNFKWLDLDIEGAAYRDSPSYKRRNKALVILQRQFPDLTLSFTLPVEMDGMPRECVDMLQDAKQQGVKIDVVNVMTMFIGRPPTGEVCVKMATAAYNQIRQIGLTASIGICPNIGFNEDNTTNPFRPEDATTLVNWAKGQSWVRWLTFWSIGRDKASGEGRSGVNKADHQFSKIFMAL